MNRGVIPLPGCRAAGPKPVLVLFADGSPGRKGGVGYTVVRPAVERRKATAIG